MSLNNNLHERIKNWWSKIQRKPLIEKIFFITTIILGVSAIIGGIVSGCVYYVHWVDKWNENCKEHIPIVVFVIALLVAIIAYATQHGRMDDPYFNRLQERCGDNNAAVVFICAVNNMYFFAAFTRVIMQGNILFEFILWVFVIGFFSFIIIPISWLEKIKKIINIKQVKKILRG